MLKYKLLILTDSVADYRNHNLHAFLRNTKQFCFPKEKKIGGHFAVTRSLLHGLDQIGIKYLYNEPIDYRLPQLVHVLSDINALKQAIILKKTGAISKLVAGPNLVVSPLDESAVLCDPAIDTVIVNSNWTNRAYAEQAPEIKNHLVIWPAGVDEEYWQPLRVNKDRILLYLKHDNTQEIKKINTILSKYSRVEVLRYGQYHKEEFKQALSDSKLAVFFTGSESQGIALLESWAMDVPTLVWKGDGTKGTIYNTISTAPYLTKSTGRFWGNTKQLEIVVKQVLEGKLSFAPRTWVLKNQTDKLCAENLLKLVMAK